MREEPQEIIHGSASDTLRPEPTLEQTFRLFLAPAKDEASRKRSEEAFRSLYCQLHPRLSAYCWRMVGAARSDIMQEVWERVIRLRTREANAEPIATPLGFCFRIARNLCLDHLERSPRFEELNQIASVETANSDIEAVVLEALERLSIEDREVLVLNIFSGYSFGEIAELLDKSPDAIWARASRARIRLRLLVRSIAKEHGVQIPEPKVKISRE